MWDLITNSSPPLQQRFNYTAVVIKTSVGDYIPQLYT